MPNTSTTNIAIRNANLDIIKGIGIVLVVFGHNWAVLHEKGILFRIIFSFHMPLFFFISGILTKESDSLTRLIQSRAHSLLKPYASTLIFICITMLTWKTLKHQPLDFSVPEYFTGILYATGRTLIWVQLWFLPHLFIVSIAAFFSIKYLRTHLAIIILAFIILAIGVATMGPDDLPWSIDLLPTTLSFFLTGYVCRNFARDMKFNAAAFIAALITFTLLHFFYSETMDLNLRSYGEFFVTTIQAYAGIYLCFSLAAFITKYKKASQLLSYIGSGTLFILLFHIFFQSMAFRIITKFTAAPLLPIFGSLIAGIALPIIFWEITKKSKTISLIFLPPKRSTQ